MRGFSGRGAKGFVVMVLGSALLLTGCSQSMMAEKKMVDKDMPKESVSKDDAMKKEEMMTKEEMMKKEEMLKKQDMMKDTEVEKK